MGTVIVMGVLSLVLLFTILKDGVAIDNILADATVLAQGAIQSLEGR